MNDNNSGPHGALRVFGILYSVFCFGYGLYSIIAFSTTIYYSYDPITYETTGVVKLFNGSLFTILFFALLFYMALPMMVTIISFKMKSNPRLALPAFILNLALFPGISFISFYSIFYAASGGGMRTNDLTGYVLFALLTLVAMLEFLFTFIVLIKSRKFCEPEKNETAKKIKTPSIEVTENDPSESFDKIKKAKELLDSGAITEDEYKTIKSKLLK